MTISAQCPQHLPTSEAGLAFYRDGFQFKPKRGPTGINHSTWEPKQILLDDCGETARALLERN